MPKPQKHKCTGHIIRFCPEVKDALKERRKLMMEISKKVNIRYEEIVNSIILESMNDKDKYRLP